MAQNHSDNVPNLPEFSVSEIAAAVKRAVEDNFGYIRIRGEISGFLAARSGHLYFSLKDEKAVIESVIWRGTAEKLRFQPEDGLEVICTGKLSTYAPRSRYQLVVDALEPAGVGALMALLEERRTKLAAEGLFAEHRKQALPYLPQVIGVVTSPTGAVIRDILQRLGDRFPSHLLLWPVLVQGDKAAEQVATAIRGFNAIGGSSMIPRPDLLIVARGGGSIEDLWSFNEEVVARAAAESNIPLISAVGHETDTTLIDLVADRRAPTPTAAAEMAVPVRLELISNASDLSRRLNLSVQRGLTQQRSNLIGLTRGLRGPRELMALAQQSLDECTERLNRALLSFGGEKHGVLISISARLRLALVADRVDRSKRIMAELKMRLSRIVEEQIKANRLQLTGQSMLLESLSFERVLDRGFAMVRKKSGALVVNAAGTGPGDALAITFRDGDINVTVDGYDGVTKRKSEAGNTATAKNSGQGSLF